MNKVRLLTVAIFIAVISYAAYSLIRITTTSAPDFSVYYHSAENLVSRRNIYLTRDLYTGLGYPPFSLIPYIPFTLIPYQVAQAMFIALSAFALLGSILVAAKTYRPDSFGMIFPWVCILAFLSFPVKFTFGMGQINLIVLFLILSSVYYRNTRWLSVTLASLVLVLKPHFILIMPFLFFTPYRLVIIPAFVVTAVISGATALLFGLENYMTYMQRTIPELAVFRGREIYYNQGLAAFFARTLPDVWAAILTYLSSEVLYAIMLLLIIKRTKDPSAVLAASMPVLLFIEPLSWQHHYVFLLPTFLFLSAGMRLWSREALFLALSYALISWNIRNPDVLNAVPLGAIMRSHVFIGTAIVFYMAIKRYVRNGSNKHDSTV